MKFELLKSLLSESSNQHKINEDETPELNHVARFFMLLSVSDIRNNKYIVSLNSNFDGVSKLEELIKSCLGESFKDVASYDKFLPGRIRGKVVLPFTAVDVDEGEDVKLEIGKFCDDFNSHLVGTEIKREYLQNEIISGDAAEFKFPPVFKIEATKLLCMADWNKQSML